MRISSYFLITTLALAPTAFAIPHDERLERIYRQQEEQLKLLREKLLKNEKEESSPSSNRPVESDISKKEGEITDLEKLYFSDSAQLEEDSIKQKTSAPKRKRSRD